MKQYATSSHLKWLLVFLAWLTLGATHTLAQDVLILSKNADHSTQDRDFDEGDTIFLKVESSDVDFASVRFGEFRLTSRSEEVGYEGEFLNNFDGTYTAEILVSDIDLTDHLWTWDGFIEDGTGNTFESRVLIRIGAPDDLGGFGVRAVVEEKGDDFFTLKGYEFQVTDETQFFFSPYHHYDQGENEDGTVEPPPPTDGEPILASFDELEAGYAVQARVTQTESGELVAQEVEIRGKIETPSHVTLTGKVEEVDTENDAFVILGRRVVVNPETFIANSQAPLGDDEVPAWLTNRLVRVYGAFLDDGSIEAHFVELKEGVRAELEVRGRVEGIANRVITVQGFEFLTGSATTVEYPDDDKNEDPGDDPAADKASLNEVTPGLIVRVFSVVTAQGANIAERIVIESGTDNGVRISGPAVNVTEEGFSVRGWEVAFSEYANIFDENFEPVPLEDMVEGQLVLVFGEFLAGGVIKANHVEYRRQERDEFALFGPITSRDETTLKVWDITFTITEESRVDFGPDQEGSVDELNVGQLVEVVGVPTAGGTIDIDFIHVPQGFGDAVRIRGTAGNVTAEGLDVFGQSVLIKPETQFRDPFYQPIDPTSLVDGVSVNVYGDFYEDGQIVAHEIMLSNAGREELETWGQITSIAGDLLTLGGVDFFFGENSKVFFDAENGGEEGTPDQLESGQFASALGFLDESGQLIVDWVFVPRQPGGHVRISGTVDEFTVDGITLWGQSIAFNEFTQFLGADFQPISAEDLVEGDAVDVFGEYVENNQILAHTVEVKGTETEEIHLSGRVDMFDGSTVTIGGLVFNIEDFTQVFADGGDPGPGPDDPDEFSGRASKYDGQAAARGNAGKFAGTAVDLDLLAEGVPVDIFGFPGEDGVYSATVIQIQRPQQNIKVGGPIELIEPDAIVVEGRRVLVTPETFIQNEGFEVVDFSALVEGQGVEVYGDLLPDGAVIAQQIELRSETVQFIEFWARLESIQPDVVVVGGTPFVITDATFIGREDSPDPLTVDDLLPGQEVFISGERDDTGLLVATQIFIPGDYVWVWMRGELLAAEGDILAVQGLTVVTSLETSFFDETFQPITANDLAVGQVVALSGQLEDTGEVNAYNVEVQGGDFEELEVNGPLTSVEGDILEVSGQFFYLTEDTYVFDEQGEEVALGDLEAGLFANILARADENGDLFAVKVFVAEPQNDSNLRLRGAIQELTAEGLVIQDRTVVFTDETMIVGPGYEPIPVEALSVGQVVGVWGSFDEFGNIAAYKVEADGQQLEEIEFRGPIVAVDGDLIVVRDFEFFLSEETQIQDQNGFPVEPEFIEVGMLANVIGAPNPDGGFSLVFMHVGAGDGDRHINLSGAIEAIDFEGRTMVVQGQSIWVEEWVEVVGANFDFIPFEELQMSQNVRVNGGYELGNSVHAYRVEVRGNAGSDELEFSGRIESVTPDAIKVRGVTFSRSEQTYIDDGQGGSIPFEELVVGQVVRISGTPLDAASTERFNEHTALWISVQTGNEDRSIRISGRLSDIVEDTRVLKIRDHVIELNDYVEIVGNNYEPISFDGLKADRQVSVWGWLHEDGRIEGWRVELRIIDRLELNVVGPVTDVFDGGVEVQGLPFDVSDDTFIGAPDIGRLRLSDLFPGVIVEVVGVTEEDGSLSAGNIQLLGLDQSRSIEVFGGVQNFQDNTFDIGGIPFAVADETFVLDGNDQRIAATSIEEGFNVEVFAIDEVNDRLAAGFVRVFDIVLDERSLIGRIDELTNDGFVLNGFPISVNDETVYINPVGDEMSFDDLFARMRIGVDAIALPNGTLVARKVELRPRDRKLTGTVTEISADGMVVAGLDISFGLSTVILDSEDMEIDATEIATGLTVNVTMTLGPGGVPLATEVKVLARIEDEVVLNGTIEAVLDDLVVVLGRRFQIIPNTQLLDANDAPTTTGSFAVGDLVRVRALLLAGDNLVALRVRALDGEASDIRVEGPIVTVSESTLEVMGIFFFLDDDSQFFDLDRNEVSATDLAEGQTVSVIAEGQANGTVVAQRVQVQNVSLTSGEVTGIEGDQFELFGNSYRVDDNTMVLGGNNEQLSLNDIQGGQFLEVRGTEDAEGSVAGKTNSASILVSKIKIVDAEGSGDVELEVDTGDGDGDGGDGGTGTSVADEELPEEFELLQNYPNPFNPTTTIRFALPINAQVTLKVYDITGREVQTLVTSTMNAGRHQVVWDGSAQNGQTVASGVYFYRLEAGDQIMTRRMVMLK